MFLSKINSVLFSDLDEAERTGTCISTYNIPAKLHTCTCIGYSSMIFLNYKAVANTIGYREVVMKE